MSDLLIQKPDIHGHIKRVEFNETREQNDSVPCVRLYCTMAHEAYNLQIRGTTHIGDRHNTKGKKERNLIATISLSWADLVQIAAFVAKEKKDRAKYVTEQEDYQIYPPEVIRQGLESNAREFNTDDCSVLTRILTLVDRGDYKAAREVIDVSSETVRFYTIKPDDQ